MKMLTKRILAIVLSVLLVISVIPLTASAQELSGTCGENVNWSFNTENGELSITGTGDMENYPADEFSPWFSSSNDIKTVTIADGVTGIGDYAFYGCENLTDATIPDSVTDIGDYAFYGCKSLIDVTIPDSVANIGDGMFYECTALTSLTFPDGITNIPDGIFYSCESLTSVTIPESVTTIGEYAFSGCTALPEINIPDSVTTISVGAFYCCEALTSMIIPKNVSSIGLWAFYDCISMESITVDPENPVYRSDGNCIIASAAGALLFGFNSSVIPDDGSIKSIGNLAFFECKELKNIILPESVTSIGNRAFDTCTGLTGMTVPDSVTSIGVSAFGFCYNIAFYCNENSYALQYAKENHIPYYLFGTFDDVPENVWYTDAAMWCAAQGYISGTGDAAFSPDMVLTRAQFVQILAKLSCDDLDAVTYTAKFDDVPDGKWYTKAVMWCVENGITGGTGNGKFSPDGEVTREQLASFLRTYAEKKGKDVSGRTNITGYADYKDVAGWAKEPMSWAVNAGLISSTSKTEKLLAPKTVATRAQVALIIKNLCENILK